MDWENYCKTLEMNLNEKCTKLHEKENRIKELEELINTASSKLEEYYQQQKENRYFSNDGKRLILSVIENCQKIIEGIFEI